ncbi:MAG: class I SAM-dependent methyltransferase [Firmicutes bacterium]|nr:class I SAM-dependent methyltransferase [Alicyclobacillaceae bacterium]MCL6497647.1 class I SAM-dependent methyltransferase [Bacillota bacterium]
MEGTPAVGWALAVAVLAAGWFGLRAWGQIRPAPMPARWERLFLNNPVRRRWFGPRQLLAAFGPLTGLSVAEIGVGTGVILEALAQAVGPSGKVWGVDVQPAAVAETGRRLTARGLSASLAVADATQLPWADRSMDRVAMVAVFGEIPPAQRAQALAEVRRVLAPSGRLGITEFWPDPHYQPPSRLLPQLRSLGWRILAVRQSPLIYTVVAEPMD